MIIDETKPTIDEKEELVDFKIIQEPWNIYELEDETIIKSRIILQNIIGIGERDEEGKRLSRFTHQIIHAVHSPKKIRGTPAKNLSVQELEKYITDKNLKFRKIQDGGNNIYETEKGIINMELRIEQIDKTSRYNEDGHPAYIMRSQILVMTEKKEK